MRRKISPLTELGSTFTDNSTILKTFKEHPTWPVRHSNNQDSALSALKLLRRNAVNRFLR